MSYLKPQNKIPGVVNDGSTSKMIVTPATFAQIGGLTNASKIGKKNAMTLKKPGQTINK